jgi:hypothetical protein
LRVIESLLHKVGILLRQIERYVHFSFLIFCGLAFNTVAAAAAAVLV